MSHVGSEPLRKLASLSSKNKKKYIYKEIFCCSVFKVTVVFTSERVKYLTNIETAVTL